MPADYDSRASQYGFASKSQLEECLSKSSSNSSKVYVIDVRSPTEIADAGQWDVVTSSSSSSSSLLNLNDTTQHVTIHGVTPTDATPVVDWLKKQQQKQKQEEDALSNDDTDTKTNKFIVYCRSGRRADTAIAAIKKEMETSSQECECLNAGGLDDLKGMGFPVSY